MPHPGTVYTYIFIDPPYVVPHPGTVYTYIYIDPSYVVPHPGTLYTCIYRSILHRPLYKYSL